MTQTLKLADVIAAHKITMSCTRVDSNPNMDGDMDHWRCLISRPEEGGRKRHTMTVTFSQGYGHHGAEPELASVLDCLASDAAGVENAQGFEDWCSDYGYDTDSRKPEKVYKACEREVDRLKRFLGEELYKDLLWNTERE
jgi:hypothetical protein